MRQWLVIGAMLSLACMGPTKHLSMGHQVDADGDAKSAVKQLSSQREAERMAAKVILIRLGKNAVPALIAVVKDEAQGQNKGVILPNLQPSTCLQPAT